MYQAKGSGYIPFCFEKTKMGEHILIGKTSANTIFRTEKKRSEKNEKNVKEC